MADAALAFLFTYALHSSILLLATAAFSRWSSASPRAREIGWKTAVLGGIVSAALTVGGAPRIEPMAFSVAIGTPEAPATLAVEALDRPTPSQGEAGFSGESGPPAAVEPAGAQTSIASFALGAWVLVATLLVGRIALQHRRAMVLLRSRVTASRGDLTQAVSQLRRTAGVRRLIRLSVSPSCSVPLAIGRSEICVPERFLWDLDREEQEAALAHELAHLVRRDPIWNVVTGVIESLFFFQPLNRLATARIRFDAELNADDWAARQLGSGTGLARGLTSIASWVNESRIVARVAVAMTAGGGPLSRRVERLLTGRLTSRKTAIPIVLGSSLLVVAVAAAGPAVTPARDHVPDFTPLVSGAMPDIAGNFTWRRHLSSGAVEVKGPVGDVRFSRADGPEVEITAVTSGPDYRDVRFEVLEHEGGITICAIFPPSPWMPENRCEPGPWRIHGSTAKARADFHVKLPPGIDATAHSMTGDILLWSPPADASIHTETGRIALYLEESDWLGRAVLTNGSGAISIRHLKAPGIGIDVESRNGRIETALPVLGRTSWGPRTPVEGVHGRQSLGSLVQARSEHGDIEVQTW